MKKLFSFMVILLPLYFHAQTQYDVLVFDYDIAGNQITRELICISCDNPLRPAHEHAEEESIALTQSSEYEQLSYYPNPVLEQLYIKWVNNHEIYVTTIEVYSIRGQKVKRIENLKGADNHTIDFGSFAQGIYTVLLMYNNNTVEDLKVIKK
ncbi:T9SS type A sorting domain-containing protein [Flavobacterium salilacus subsp. salilacus]|uniref:T9SS type A sorting domain-containing protein n=1 Tax=Flavobacterium TaxID=237 RepID=UPI00107521AC|nr:MULTISPECIES: T9SS type A sorting domain-containing protein [Flavobacterium]KAF2515832.1 T9SS type A sorting domain-containing protein [Flavobacterium salilacus subsp. salilacus]MBE1615363.1 T9SS type A sorting domain-containing protein [Flavobacterium sp. SaA2.13]